MKGPLENIRVLDFSEIIAGPFAGMLLSDMGADVIKIEPPWGEPWRFSQPIVPNESRTYISLNRGKKSLTLDLNKDSAKQIIYDLINDIDVVIVNYRPDVPANLGIDYDTLSKMNPKLIYCQNTAYGSEGNDSYRPGYDIIIQAMSGLMAADGKLNEGIPQSISATALADFSTALTMSMSICAALHARSITGKGQKIEASLLATALALQTTSFLEVEMVDKEPKEELIETINLLRETGAPYSDIHDYVDGIRLNNPAAFGIRMIYYRTYQAKDSVIAVACLSDRLRKKMADAIGIYDRRFEPGYKADQEDNIAFTQNLRKEVEELFLTKTVQEWMEVLDSAGVPCGPVKFVSELMTDNQVIANDIIREHEHPLVGKIKMIGPIVKMSETPLVPHDPSPTLGQNNDEILSALGYSEQKIKELRDSGAVGE
tara:strand:+ start:1824 stop:3110 length:1287 start_codon:yes stop_codon:yes gene_type:complete